MSSIFDRQELTFSDLASAIFIRIDRRSPYRDEYINCISSDPGDESFARLKDWEEVPAEQIPGFLLKSCAWLTDMNFDYCRYAINNEVFNTNLYDCQYVASILGRPYIKSMETTYYLLYNIYTQQKEQAKTIIRIFNNI